jgi:8-oxo-dGTP pyrophosphatase MutT (NUDIX family)
LPVNDSEFDIFAVMSNIEEVAVKLKNRLKRPLPGTSAQLKMASDIRLNEMVNGYDIKNARKSSVLILLYPDNSNIYFVLIKRRNDGGVHSGQISFPGGAMEKSDGSFYETALREANEEVGIDTGDVKIIGSLTELYIPPSNFLVFPVLGYMNTRPVLTPDPGEVAGIIEADLFKLVNTGKAEWKKINVRGYKVNSPYYDIGGHTVWGATAMILSEFIEIIKSS